MFIKLKDGKEKVLTLSYDDGVVADKRFADILNKHGIKCTFNINTGLYAPEDSDPNRTSGRMTLKEMQELYIDSGHELAVHSLTHPRLELLKATDIIYETIEDRKNIERDFGTIARGMAYPFGTYSDEVVDVLAKCGIVYSRTVKSTENFEMPTDWLRLPATAHHNNPRLMELADKFINENPRFNAVWMFYLWGHSYEFDNNDNWNVIEEFAEKVSGKDDIWYATNIEVYDYVQAYNQLQASYDEKIIHNPTATDVWVTVDEETFVVKAGETVHR